MVFRVGTSGWSYEHWQDVFYPPELPKGRLLDYYARTFDTVEINASFYRLPTGATFAKWRDQVPPGFVFAVKASRYLTHVRRLAEPEEPWDRLIGNARELGDKLGPVLFQLPANWRLHLDRLERLLAVLPTTHRYAFEFRHPSWFAPEVYELLRSHGAAALCIADSPRWPSEQVITADFTFIRFHGARALYGSLYGRQELKAWAGRIEEWLGSRLDVFAYFNNDASGYAVRNALELRQMVGGTASRAA